MQEPQIWNRLDGETDKAWAAFQIYRTMPPAERSILGAYVIYSGKEKAPANAPQHFNGWSSKNNWGERVRAWDRYQDDIHVDISRDQEHIRRLREYRETLLRYSKESTESAITTMKLINNTIASMAGEDGDGTICPKLVPKYIVAASRLFETATAAEAEALAVERILDIIPDAPQKVH